MNDAHSYFPVEFSAAVTCSCEYCASELSSQPVAGMRSGTSPSPQAEVCDSKDTSCLLSLAVQVIVTYVGIAMKQFDGFVSHSSRQVNCK